LTVSQLSEKAYGNSCIPEMPARDVKDAILKGAALVMMANSA
jgi:hypothetical protein